MTNIFKMSLCVLLLTSASLSPARADNACPGFEAKTASGGCVNPMLSASLRQRSILLSQQRISEQAFPILPSQDRVYPRPGEFNRFELIGVTRRGTLRTPGIFGTSSRFLSCHPNC
ncbi:hypothetical protein FNL56_27090 [Tardiphaga sp. vice304]|uniref:hypothetical protein n=1 Tax=Tardiphaga sp. vice304 TaxID=2592817 RepID=UPI001162865B|nr:hypothetical protein [Tardiphaga sp. vice304]QDM29364.1 hypothetical protein FNL56_27090 [Tardiphaga sp. vice304]